MQKETMGRLNTLLEKWRGEAERARKQAGSEHDRYHYGLSDGLALACDDLARLVAELTDEPEARGRWAWEGGQSPDGGAVDSS